MNSCKIGSGRANLQHLGRTANEILNHVTKSEHPILEVRNLTRRFGGLTAVNDLSFTVAPGTIHGLIGPNGAGKTTTFNVISGFYAPTSGHVIYEGNDVSGRKTAALAEMARVLKPGGALIITRRAGWEARTFWGRSYTRRQIIEELDGLGIEEGIVVDWQNNYDLVLGTKRK